MLLNDDRRKVVSKNRRFEALSKMLKEDQYFSETEMMKRNPLLYEQLVGQYLSEKEKLARDNIDLKNITLLNVLMEGVDRQHTKDVLERQKCNEESQMEENSSDDESIEEETTKEGQRSQWGEYTVADNSSKAKPKSTPVSCVTGSERALLREEFIQEMYRSFLAGEDENIDYKSIDNSTEFDCLDLRIRDEEEKYFDSETPEEVKDSSPGPPIEDIDQSTKPDDSEDELDVFMKHLKEHPSLRNVNFSD